MNSIYCKGFRLVLLFTFCPCFCLTSLYHCNFDTQTSSNCLLKKTLDAPTLIHATGSLQDEIPTQTLTDNTSILTYAFVKTPRVGAFDHTYSALVKKGENSMQCLDFYYYITDSSHNAKIGVELDIGSTRQPIIELIATPNSKWQHCQHSYSRPSSSTYHVTATNTKNVPEEYVLDATSSGTSNTNNPTMDTIITTTDISSITTDTSSITTDTSSITTDTSSITTDTSSITTDTSSDAIDTSATTIDKSITTTGISGITTDTSITTSDQNIATTNMSSITTDIGDTASYYSSIATGTISTIMSTPDIITDSTASSSATSVTWDITGTTMNATITITVTIRPPTPLLLCDFTNDACFSVGNESVEVTDGRNYIEGTAFNTSVPPRMPLSGLSFNFRIDSGNETNNKSYSPIYFALDDIDLYDGDCATVEQFLNSLTTTPRPTTPSPSSGPNLALILGLSLGLGIPAVAGAVGGSVYYFGKKKHIKINCEKLSHRKDNYINKMLQDDRFIFSISMR
ncbi:unnamed protein product [Rotaria sp. Silwood1]|nr:unnamed protein product [Rotaria sp. Silwood1]